MDKQDLKTEQKVYKGKWGFYPCSREIYLKLKKINHRILQTKHKASAWHRWARKATHNRKGTEPEICLIFSEKIDKDRSNSDYCPDFANEAGRYAGIRTSRTYWVKDGRKELKYIDKPGTWITIPINADKYRYQKSKNGGCIEVDSFGIDRAYTLAKHPKTTAEEVEPIDITEEWIEKIYKKII